MGGVGGGIAYNVEEFREIAGARPEPVADPRGPGRAVGHRLEGIRARGDARRRRQLRRHLLDREHRSDGRAHRRQHHRRAGADADRQGIPAHARRGAADHPPGRRRDRRLEHPVRDQPRGRPPGRHRDEPARLAVVGAGVEGDRLPDREDRRQAGARLPPRRDPERHHARHAGVVRADHRLRRRQDPALGVREVPAGRRDADHADEVGRRGDGHRPHLQAGVPEGHPLARAGQPHVAVRPAEGRDRRAAHRAAAPARDPERSPDVGAVPGPRARLDDRADPRADARSIPWFLDPVRRDPGDGQRGEGAGQGRADAEAPALPQAPGLRGQRSRAPRRLRRERDPRRAAAPPRSRRPTSASTPAPPSSSRSRRISTAATTRSARRRRRRRRRSSSSAAGRTASARASSSTTAAVTPPSRCATPATRR